MFAKTPCASDGKRTSRFKDGQLRKASSDLGEAKAGVNPQDFQKDPNANDESPLHVRKGKTAFLT